MTLLRIRRAASLLALATLLAGCEAFPLRAPPPPDEEKGGAAVLDEVPDEDFVSTRTRDREEEENEPHEGDFEPEANPREIEDPRDIAGGEFGEVLEDQIRVASLNLHLLTRNTARRNPEGQAGGRSENRVEMLFRMLDEANIAIIALQEVYVVTDFHKQALRKQRPGEPPFPKSVHAGQQMTDHPLFAFADHTNGRFRIFPGGPTKKSRRGWKTRDGRFRISMKTEEYLPIIVDTSKVTCDPARERTDELANGRFIHILESCAIVEEAAPNRLDFSFASTHLSWKDKEIRQELTAIREYLPQGSESAGIDPDFLIGGDFNSSSTGHLKETWGTLPDLSAIPVMSFATKWVRRLDPPPTRFIVSDQGDRRHLDDIAFFEPTNEDYVDGSKRVMQKFPRWFTADAAGMNGYATFSDHFMVILDLHKFQDTN